MLCKHQQVLIQSILIRRNMIDCHCHITAEEFEKVGRSSIVVRSGPSILAEIGRAHV